VSISQTVENLVARWREVLLAVIGLLVVVSVIQTYIRTRSWVPTIGVILVGAVAMWGVSRVEDIQGRVQTEIDQAPNYREGG
jgi:uncharacterized membrane protein